MKKLLFLGLVVAVVAAFPLTHEAHAKKDQANKTWLCHITGEGETPNGALTYVGHVIHVSNNAVPAHCSPKKGVADHNPAPGNREVGNACGRRQDRNPPCEVGG